MQQGACGRCAAHLLSNGGRRCSSSSGGGRRCLSLLGRRAQQQVQCGQLNRVGRPGFPHARDRQAVCPGDRALSRCVQSPVFHQGLTSSDMQSHLLRRQHVWNVPGEWQCKPACKVPPTL